MRTDLGIQSGRLGSPAAVCPASVATSTAVISELSGKQEVMVADLHYTRKIMCVDVWLCLYGERMRIFPEECSHMDCSPWHRGGDSSSFLLAA